MSRIKEYINQTSLLIPTFMGEQVFFTKLFHHWPTQNDRDGSLQ